MYSSCKPISLQEQFPTVSLVLSGIDYETLLNFLLISVNPLKKDAPQIHMTLLSQSQDLKSNMIKYSQSLNDEGNVITIQNGSRARNVCKVVTQPSEHHSMMSTECSVNLGYQRVLKILVEGTSNVLIFLKDSRYHKSLIGRSKRLVMFLTPLQTMLCPGYAYELRTVILL